MVVPAYPDASRVTLAGSSAGGFGALINYEHVRETFGNKRVDLIADSSPVMWMNAPIFSGLSTWNVNLALPAGCPDCKRDLRGLYAYYSAKYPDARMAVTTRAEDMAMSLAGYALPIANPQYTNALNSLTLSTLGPLPNFKYFVAGGSVHGWQPLDSVSQPQCCNWLLGVCAFPRTCGKALSFGDWLTEMESDDPNWKGQSSIAK